MKILSFQRNVPKLMVFAAFLLFLVLPLSAQQDNSGQSAQTENSSSFKQAELKKFAQVMKQVQAIQVESNQKIESAFSDSSMSKERFESIYSSRQQGKQETAKNETESETKEFQKLAQQIQTIQQNGQKEMVETVRENDMTVQKFNEIVKAIRTNPQLGERIQQLM